MNVLEIVISAGITLFSIGLFLLSIMSYQKFKNKKILFISLIILVILIKGILLSLSIYSQELLWIQSYLFSGYSGLFDLAILSALFLAILKR